MADPAGRQARRPRSKDRPQRASGEDACGAEHGERHSEVGAQNEDVMQCEDGSRDRYHDVPGQLKRAEPAINEPPKGDFLKEAVTDAEPGSKEPEFPGCTQPVFLDNGHQRAGVRPCLEHQEPHHEDEAPDHHPAAEAVHKPCGIELERWSIFSHALEPEDEWQTVQHGLACRVDRTSQRTGPEPERAQGSQRWSDHDRREQQQSSATVSD